MMENRSGGVEQGGERVGLKLAKSWSGSKGKRE